ncbi:hypothetical protein [Streptomyces sp. NPDC001269]
MLDQPDALAYLAHALDAPVEDLGARAPERPVWVCSVRSDPRHPDLTDSQWAEVARRVVAATGIAPEGDPDACRWIAVRNQARLVHVVATLAREDGGVHHAYRDAAGPAQRRSRRRRGRGYPTVRRPEPGSGPAASRPRLLPARRHPADRALRKRDVRTTCQRPTALVAAHPMTSTTDPFPEQELPR